MTDTEDYTQETEDYYDAGGAVTPCEPLLFTGLLSPGFSFSVVGAARDPIILLAILSGESYFKTVSPSLSFSYSIP